MIHSTKTKDESRTQQQELATTYRINDARQKEDKDSSRSNTGGKKCAKRKRNIVRDRPTFKYKQRRMSYTRLNKQTGTQTYAWEGKSQDTLWTLRAITGLQCEGKRHRSRQMRRRRYVREEFRKLPSGRG